MSALLMATVMCGGLFSNVAPAEKLNVSATAMAGTGVSLLGVGKRTYAGRSPTFLIGEVAISHPQLDWLEIAPSVMLEVEGRVGFAVLPKIRARLPGKRVRFWGVAALPAYVLPYTLLGVQVGAGVSISLHKRIALVAEFTGTAYVWGSDLVKKTALGKLDETFGLRVTF